MKIASSTKAPLLPSFLPISNAAMIMKTSDAMFAIGTNRSIAQIGFCPPISSIFQ